MNPSTSIPGVPPMLRSKLAPIAIALLMALPAVVVLSPAVSAQDIVPVADGVRWENQLNHEQRLFLTFANFKRPTDGKDALDKPDCTSNAQTPDPSTATLELLQPSDRLENTRQPCAFVAQVASQTAPVQAQASFKLRNPLAHSFNVTGNTSLIYVHQGGIPSNVKLVVQVKRNENVVSTLEIPGEDGKLTFSKAFPLGATSSAEFRAGERIQVAVAGVVTSDGTGVPSTAAATWTLSDMGSHLAVRSPDSLKAATWTTDEAGNVKSLFRPLDKNVTTTARLVGWFAVQSAFSIGDARGYPDQTGVIPRFSLERGGFLRPLGTGDNTTAIGEYSSALSGTADARSVWRFPADLLDYRNLEAGEYNLTVDFSYHQGAAFRHGILSKVLITTQSIRLTPFDDNDPTTSPSPLETNAHDIASGGTTTYVFLVNNTGSVNDTVRLDATFISGSPAGWAATLGGPHVTENRVTLAPRQAEIVTLTVTAPANAGVGASSIFQLQAVSLVDPTAKSLATTVVSTVSNAVAREVRLITPIGDIGIVPGEDTLIPVYVWNRGTRFATVALEVRGTLAQDWVVQFAQGDSGAGRIVVPSVPAGGIVAATLRVHAPVTLAEGGQDVILNATQTDVSGIASDTPMRFVLRPVAGVKVRILDRIAGEGHVAELTGNFTGGVTDVGSPVGGTPPPPPAKDPRCNQEDTARTRGTGCFEDGVDGAWFRVWTTNTGRRTDQFDLRIDSVSKPDCDAAFGAPGLFFRDVKGQYSPRSTLLLKPGQTGELYAWVPVTKDSDDAGCEGDTLSFVVEAKGRETKALGRDGASLLAVDNSGENYANPVLLEHVARLSGYSAESPYVDIGNATRTGLTTGIEVNTSQSYFVRVTNGAAWSDYTDPYKPGNPTIPANVRLSVAGVDRDLGWNVSLRRANGDLNTNTNPWVDTLTFGNQNNNRREAWSDYEVEVRIQAPRGENGTGLAGDQDQFTLQATMVGDKKSTLDFKAIITEFANVSIEADSLNVFAHPGQAGAALVYVNNTGSSRVPVSLRASVDPSTPNAAAWTVEPAVQTFTLDAFKNRTAALLITPPGGAASGDVTVTVEYAPSPVDLNRTVNRSIHLSTQVVPRGSLTLAATATDVSIAPGGFANYTLNLVNTGTLPVSYQVAATSIPNWTATLSPLQGSIGAGETKAIVYVLKAPTDVTDGNRFSSVVKVEELGNAQNFDIRPVTVSILGGKALPSVSVPKVQKTVDRNGVQFFEVAVKNLGSAAGRIDLSARSQDPSWAVGVQNARGDPVSFVNLQPNELVVVNVTVRAPLTVAENTLIPVELVAEAGGVAAKATLQALVHDYGVSVGLKPSQVDAAPGVPVELTLTLRNVGNDNDTLNVSANLVDLPEWRVDLSLERVRLEPGQSADVRAIVRQPIQPLPTPRGYSLKFFAGTLGGVAVNIPKNESIVGVVNVLNYRPMDVDRDDQLEVAVDADRNPANGFEKFQEISPDGVTSTVVAVGKLDGKARFFLDVPRDRPVDGVADVWFDPESVYAYEIRHAPDVNNDNSPDYLLDTNRDGKVDKAFDAVTQTYWSVTELKAYGDERVQYLIDLGNDNRPDRYYDADQSLVTRTYSVEGQKDAVGLDTNNDGKVDKVYDLKTSSVSDARLTGATSFFGKYWYFFVGFAILVLVTVLLLVMRGRRT